MGEVLYISLAGSSGGNEHTQDKVLAEAVRRFCRSIELCEGYLRGYYGLKMVILSMFLQHLIGYTLNNRLRHVVGYRPLSGGTWPWSSSFGCIDDALE